LDNSRLLISILAVLGVLFLYQEMLQWRYPELYGPKAKQAQAAKRAAQAAATPGPQNALASAGAGANSAPAGPAGGAAALSSAPERTLKIETSYYEALLTSRGARMVSFRLKKYRQDDSPDSPDYQMIRPGDRLPLGVVVVRNGGALDDRDIAYTTEAPGAIQVTPEHPATVTFTGDDGNGLKIEKSFTFRDASYVFGLSARATAANGPAPNGMGLTMSQPLDKLSGYRDYPMLQADVTGKALNEAEKPLQKGVAPASGTITYAGFGDRYFLAAFLPEKPNAGTLTMDYANGEADARLQFDHTSSVSSRVYMGPKELHTLEAVDPALSKSLNLGFFGIIALPFLRALKVFYWIAPNYGVAIILLTIVVRLVTLPMSIKGQRSMMKMQRLQPQVERIREKFKDDQERLNREMVELYKRNHVNPLGGCLPMGVQFPVFIGLYEALLNAVDLRQAPFIGWIRDLSAPDCLPIPGLTIPFTDLHGIPVLVILMAGTAFLQQWISPRNPDPNQQKMMMYMPVFFSVIFIELPAGLSLYYFASNLLGVIQQFILNREFKQYTPVTTT
jgi:YidC/Oxa1 family membrane protein insertase